MDAASSQVENPTNEQIGTMRRAALWEVYNAIRMMAAAQVVDTQAIERLAGIAVTLEGLEANSDLAVTEDE